MRIRLPEVQANSIGAPPSIVSELRTGDNDRQTFTLTTRQGVQREICIDSDVTLGIIKPDATTRGLEDAIYSRIEGLGFDVIVLARRRLIQEDIDFLYHAHIGKPYYPEIVAFMTSTEVEIFLVTGKDVVSKLNQIVGFTDPSKAQTNTIRGDLYAKDRVMPQFPNIYQNSIHSSSSDRVRDELAYFLRLILS